MNIVTEIPVKYRKPSPYKEPKVLHVKRVSQEQLKRLLELGYTVVLR